MTGDVSAQSKTTWPIPKFSFQVKWNNTVMSFRELLGLDVAALPIEYRHGDNTASPMIKMPGLVKYSSVTMKYGNIKSDNNFLDWLNQIKIDATKRVPMTINLLDESGEITMTWTLANAWSTKITDNVRYFSHI
jgi:phage tail-like protein